MLRGLPASGKSTWALEQVKKSNGEIKRVNKDELRLMLDAGVWSKSNEKFICYVRDGIITETLQEGKTIVVDDTNFYKEHQTKMEELAKLNDALFEIKDFSDVPLDECLRRDKVRAKPVGERVIYQMYDKYLKPTPPKIAFNPRLSSAILVDVDGTLALFGDANPYDRDFSKDTINEVVADIVRHKWEHGFKVVIVSGRKEINKETTERWLLEHGVPFDKILMRKTEDNRKDDIIKKEIYDNEIKGKYNVEFVLDDRDRVVKMWRDQGLTVLQVAAGKF